MEWDGDMEMRRVLEPKDGANEGIKRSESSMSL